MLGAGLGFTGLALIAVPGAAAARPSDLVCSNQWVNGGSFHDVTVLKGSWCLIGDATITGNFQALGATSIGIFDGATIAGDVKISGTTSNPNASGEIFGGTANGICTTKIGGDLEITHSGPNAPWNVGSTNYPPLVNFSNCVFTNSVGGDLVFSGNLGHPNEISGNDIGGNLVCQNNGSFSGYLVPSPKNRVKGTSQGQCAPFGTNPIGGSGPPKPGGGRPRGLACLGTLAFVIRLDSRLVSARVLVDSRPHRRWARILPGRQLRAVIDLRKLGAQRVSVTITGRTRAGRKLRFTRAYRVCRNTESVRSA
jgi:hypothetical protein